MDDDPHRAEHLTATGPGLNENPLGASFRVPTTLDQLDENRRSGWPTRIALVVVIVGVLALTAYLAFR